jgi:hypothetical protein
MFFRLASAVALLLLVLAAPRAEAQGVADSFEQLRLLVRAGDTITVRDSKGVDTTGKIDRLSSSSLLLIASGTRRELKEADVTTILQRRSDSLANGALWGLVIGLAGGGIATALMCYDGPCDASLAAVVPFYGGLGAGIGVGVDAMIVRRQVIYEKQKGSAAFGVVPLLGVGRLGAALSVTFK